MKVTKPKPGYAWNPLRAWPPNRVCFCGQMRKAKKCCLPKLKNCVPEEKVPDLKRFMEDALAGRTTEDMPKMEPNFMWIKGRFARRMPGATRQKYIEREPAFQKRQLWRHLACGIYWRQG